MNDFKLFKEQRDSHTAISKHIYNWFNVIWPLLKPHCLDMRTVTWRKMFDSKLKLSRDSITFTLLAAKMLNKLVVNQQTTLFKISFFQKLVISPMKVCFSSNSFHCFTNTVKWHTCFSSWYKPNLNLGILLKTKWTVVHRFPRSTWTGTWEGIHWVRRGTQCLPLCRLSPNCGYVSSWDGKFTALRG